MATEVILTYHVPIYVVVRNDRDGTGPHVTKVVVDDECNFDNENRRCARNDQGALLPMGNRAVAAAINLIENGNSEWPSWEFGW
jgi:hypothetical protein